MKKQLTHFIIVYSLLALCIGAIIFQFAYKPPTAESIFKNNLKTVVELKAFNDDDLDSATYGSAVCIDKTGLLITNAHVVSYKQVSTNIVFDTIQIRLASSELYTSASLEKIDYGKDLALLKVNPPGLGLVPAKMRTSELKEGETIYAIGNGQNYGISVKNSIISQRELNVIADGRSITAIQCDLNITSDNSGGALIDSKSRLIGITTFRLRDASGNTIFGTSFAIPVKMIKEFIYF